MHALLRPFFELCLLRLRPQDLPASTVLLSLALVAHTLVGVAISGADLPLPGAILAGLADTAILSVLTSSVLLVQRMGPRIVQTLTALAGAGTILGIIAVPLSTWLRDAHDAGGATALPALLLLALIAWSLVVGAHILRHALSVPFFVGIMFSIGFYWISIKVLNALLLPASG